jgi:predicted metal-dependent hydrolase
VNSDVSRGADRIPFQVVYARRQSLEIAVHPDRQVVVRAPMGTTLEAIQAKVLRRFDWIRRQLDYFRQFEPRAGARRYVGGESHLYLGRHHRLKISRGEAAGVKMIRGYFLVSVPGKGSAGEVKTRLDRWYAERAAVQFQESLERCWPTIAIAGLEMPRLRIQILKRRWGSLSARHRLTLNLDLIRAPRDCIDYVVTHELCHLRHPDHGPAFQKLLLKTMPDWEARKARLELALA